MNWDCTQRGDVYILFGDWSLPEVALCRRYFAALESKEEIVLDLQDVEIITGTAMADCITWLRELLQRNQHLVLQQAPQMLAHTLYKTNMLKQTNITLVDPRHDSGIGA